MDCRAATPTCALLSALLLVGCQNAPQQLSIYAPFGPAVVPTPSLTRANSTPYYTPPADANGSGPATAGAGNKELSHYDPYRGIMVPGNFSPPAGGLRSTETWGAPDVLATTPPRERASTEEPIRIVESGSPSIVATQADKRRNDVQFQASPPSGAVRPGLLLPLPPASIGVTSPSTAAEIATRPKLPTSLSPASALPASSAPASPSPGPFTPPPFNPVPAPPAGTNPAEPRKLSLWNDPRDGSRVMPASYGSELPRATQPSNAWRVRD